MININNTVLIIIKKEKVVRKVPPFHQITFRKLKRHMNQPVTSPKARQTNRTLMKKRTINTMSESASKAKVKVRTNLVKETLRISSRCQVLSMDRMMKLTISQKVTAMKEVT